MSKFFSCILLSVLRFFFGKYKCNKIVIFKDFFAVTSVLLFCRSKWHSLVKYDVKCVKLRQFNQNFAKIYQLGCKGCSTSVIGEGPIWQWYYNFFSVRVVIRRNVVHTKDVHCATEPLPGCWPRNSVIQIVHALLLSTKSEVGTQYKIEKKNKSNVFLNKFSKRLGNYRSWLYIAKGGKPIFFQTSFQKG